MNDRLRAFAVNGCLMKGPKLYSVLFSPTEVDFGLFLAKQT